MKSTYASQIKNVNDQGNYPFDHEGEEAENEDQHIDKADLIKIEIEKLEAGIQKLGGVQSCGWDPADHKDFLRVRTKHKERVKTVAFMTEMRRAVPTADEDTIKEHVEAFQKMQDMIEKKKDLMK